MVDTDNRLQALKIIMGAFNYSGWQYKCIYWEDNSTLVLETVCYKCQVSCIYNNIYLPFFSSNVYIIIK